jgi:predicted membrane protein
LVSHEIFLYIFDAVLMVSVMLVFAWVHPSEVYAMLKGGAKAKAVKKGIYVYNLEFRELQSLEGARSMM